MCVCVCVCVFVCLFVCVCVCVCARADMNEVEKLVRTIATDGLLWGACKPVMYYTLSLTTLSLLSLSFSDSQAGSSGLWDKETADQLCCGG